MSEHAASAEAIGIANTGLLIGLFGKLAEKGILSQEDVRAIIDRAMLSLEQGKLETFQESAAHALLSQIEASLAARFDPRSP